jgi:hypothetical protein
MTALQEGLLEAANVFMVQVPRLPTKKDYRRSGHWFKLGSGCLFEL